MTQGCVWVGVCVQVFVGMHGSDSWLRIKTEWAQRCIQIMCVSVTMNVSLVCERVHKAPHEHHLLIIKTEKSG